MSNGWMKYHLLEARLDSKGSAFATHLGILGGERKHGGGVLMTIIHL